MDGCRRRRARHASTPARTATERARARFLSKTPLGTRARDVLARYARAFERIRSNPSTPSSSSSSTRSTMSTIARDDGVGEDDDDDARGGGCIQAGIHNGRGRPVRKGVDSGGGRVS